MTGTEDFDDGALALLRCPRDASGLHRHEAGLACEHGHEFPIVMGIPVMLLADEEQTIDIASASLNAAANPQDAPLYLGTMALSDDRKAAIGRSWSPDGKVDAAISHLVGATSGFGYLHLIGRMKEYPIPAIPLEDGAGRLLLDVGSNWGRWSVSAARKGWKVVAIDPSLGSLLACRRAFAAENLDITLICGDARFLPFAGGAFRIVFSYSVLQHLSEANAASAVAEMGRVLAPGGTAKVQMAHVGGLRSRTRTRRGLAAPDAIFRVRYWPLSAIRDVFRDRIGPTTVRAEGFGGLGLLPEDAAFVSWPAKVLIGASGVLKRLSAKAPWLTNLADSVYAEARKPTAAPPSGNAGQDRRPADSDVR